MDRRDTLRTLLIGGVAGANLTSFIGCKPGEKPAETPATGTGENGLYGRTPEEAARDARLREEIYLNEHELSTIAVLCDIILPSQGEAGSATDAGVPDFIEFIVKDMPNHQLPMRGGLMWLDGESNKRYNKEFISLTKEEQISIVEDIAYPDKDGSKAIFSQGINFFDRMRGLTLTGYYTSKMGLDDLGYVGNRPNIWDGVPEDILKEHGFAYEEEWLAKCVDQSKRDIVAEWDETGKLIS